LIKKVELLGQNGVPFQGTLEISAFLAPDEHVSEHLLVFSEAGRCFLALQLEGVSHGGEEEGRGGTAFINILWQHFLNGFHLSLQNVASFWSFGSYRATVK